MLRLSPAVLCDSSGNLKLMRLLNPRSEAASEKAELLATAK
jgi:hypothetical protein